MSEAKSDEAIDFFNLLTESRSAMSAVFEATKEADTAFAVLERVWQMDEATDGFVDDGVTNKLEDEWICAEAALTVAIKAMVGRRAALFERRDSIGEYMRETAIATGLIETIDGKRKAN